MQVTSDLYKELLASNHHKEVRLAIGETGKLITKSGDAISFGGVSILVGSSGADGGYDESRLISLKTSRRVFSEDTPTVGNCVAGEISIEMLAPVSTIPRQARLVPYIRLTDGVRYSEWIQKGVYYIDTRDTTSTIGRLTIHGYDAMLKLEQDYPASALTWPARDIDVVREIANYIGVSIDSRTVAVLTRGYTVGYTTDYSCREILGYIGAMYAGCWVMSDLGELHLIRLYDLPAETRYLVTGNAEPITFGGVRICV